MSGVRPCPVCGSTSVVLLYKQHFATFRRGSIGHGYDVVACGMCGMCYATGLPDEARFTEYYANSSKYDLTGDAGELSDRERDRFAGQAAFVAAHLPDRHAPVLDIGTATGGFLQALSSAGFERPFGVDPSPDAIRVAREDQRLEVAVGGLAEAAAWDLQFGLVSYVAVLEHVLDPRAQVRAVGRLLQRDGFLFVSVPDAGSFADHAEAPFQEFSVEHVNYFTRRSLENLMAAEGYSRVAERVVVRPLGSDGLGPAIEAVYRRGGAARPAQPDDSGASSLREYIRECERHETSVQARIAELAASGEKIYVWGAGTHTLHLLETSDLGRCRIEAFLDSNPHYAGGSLVGRPVIAPTDLTAVDGPILVSSAVSQSSIAASARARFGDDVPLSRLYRGD